MLAVACLSNASNTDTRRNVRASRLIQFLPYAPNEVQDEVHLVAVAKPERPAWMGGRRLAKGHLTFAVLTQTHGRTAPCAYCDQLLCG